MKENSCMIFHTLNDKFYSFFYSGSCRTISAKKNILASFFLKVISIIVSLQVVPLTIHYVNPSQYGIWLTLSSVIAWLSYFDLGFAHGFRNRFAEAKARGEHELAKKYVSTTYAVLIVLFAFIFILISVANYFLDWSSILKVDPLLKDELKLVFQILSCFFCVNIVASIFTTLLTADQKPAFASLIQTVGQVLAFIAIYIFTKTTQGNLTYLAFAFSGIPCFFLVVVSIFLFQSEKYKQYAPSFKQVQFKLTKNILGLGGQFFVIMISMLFIFQFINIIISRIEGPEVVTQYNIASKYFNILNMLAVIVLTPFWSAFTEAYIQRDFEWMRRVQRKLEWMWLLCIPIAIVMLLCSQWLYQWWIGDSVKISFSLSVVMAIYILAQILGNVYMYIINGIGKIRLQLIIYLSFSLVSLPLLNWGCKYYGVEGILIIPTVVFFVQALLGKIQITKLINEKAKGIWNK